MNLGFKSSYLLTETAAKSLKIYFFTYLPFKTVP